LDWVEGWGVCWGLVVGVAEAVEVAEEKWLLLVKELVLLVREGCCC